MAMLMKQLASSSILATGYDQESGTLAITFKGGATYHYEGVPQELAEGLESAESPGTYFRHAIRGQYTEAKQPAVRNDDESKEHIAGLLKDAAFAATVARAKTAIDAAIAKAGLITFDDAVDLVTLSD